MTIHTRDIIFWHRIDAWQISVILHVVHAISKNVTIFDSQAYKIGNKSHFLFCVSFQAAPGYTRLLHRLLDRLQLWMRVSHPHPRYHQPLIQSLQLTLYSGDLSIQARYLRYLPGIGLHGCNRDVMENSNVSIDAPWE